MYLEKIMVTCLFVNKFSKLGKIKQTQVVLAKEDICDIIEKLAVIRPKFKSQFCHLLVEF